MDDLEKIKNIIKRKELTAYEVATRTGLSEPGIRKIITGKTKNPNPATIKLVLYELLKDEKTDHTAISENKERTLDSFIEERMRMIIREEMEAVLHKRDEKFDIMAENFQIMFHKLHELETDYYEQKENRHQSTG